MTEFRNPICLLRGFWWNLRYGWGAWGEGMVISEEQSSADPMVQTLKCRTCGFESVGKL